LTAILTIPAQRDIEAAAEWYENQRDGLGLEFTDRVLEAIEAIERNPFGHAKVIGDARRALLNQFPYALWFKIETAAIVIACLHHKRDIRLARERAAGAIEIPKKPER
jgi:plasmid stabilization system protein ParE